MKASDFDFVLPPELIAPFPAAERDGSALMVLPRSGPQDVKVSQFSELGAVLPARSLLVLNETRVLPARLMGHKPTGGRVEVLLLSCFEGASPADLASAEGGEVQLWDAMARGLGRSVGPASEIRFAGNLVAQIVSRGEQGAVRVRLQAPRGRRVAELIEEVGEVPLPPYIVAARETMQGSPEGEAGAAEGARRSEDRERYQTVYATTPGAVAAPTAGLHFTSGLMERLRAAGHDFVPLTLHVGPGTFRPVRGEDIDQHPMDVERYSIPPATAAAIEDARRTGRAIVAVGTTVVRTLEASARESADGAVRPGEGATALFLRPGAAFRVVTDLITNFHLPRSTLLMLVAAFAGRERILAAYEEAIRQRLRFYSYGDAMFIRGTP